MRNVVYFLAEGILMEIETLVMYGFDLFGTCVFAVTGAVRGVRIKLDFLGVVVFACIVGVGGGVFRDLLLGATPVAAYNDETYLIICIFTGMLVFFIAPQVVGRWQIIRIFDAIGLGIFTAIGTAKGMQYGVSDIGIILSGVFTAVGGGVLRDMMARTVPLVLTSDFYATASLIGGVVFLLLSSTELPFYATLSLTALVVTSIRIIAMRAHLHLPVAKSWAIFPEDVGLEVHLDGGEKKK